jgi:predicted dehydrogenase
MSCLNSAAFERISASAIKTRPEFNGPNIWNARLELADGSMFVLDIGWFIPELPASTIAITGPNGTITVDSRTGAAILQRNGQRESLKLAPLSQNWAGQLDAFAESIDRGEAKVATVHDGLRALQATIDCEESALLRSN